MAHFRHERLTRENWASISSGIGKKALSKNFSSGKKYHTAIGRQTNLNFLLEYNVEKIQFESGKFYCF